MGRIPLVLVFLVAIVATGMLFSVFAGDKRQSMEVVVWYTTSPDIYRYSCESKQVFVPRSVIKRGPPFVLSWITNNLPTGARHCWQHNAYLPNRWRKDLGDPELPPDLLAYEMLTTTPCSNRKRMEWRAKVGNSVPSRAKRVRSKNDPCGLWRIYDECGGQLWYINEDPGCPETPQPTAEDDEPFLPKKGTQNDIEWPKQRWRPYTR